MTRRERVRIEMLLRVRDFGNSYADLLRKAPAGQQALATVTSAVEQIETLMVAKALSGEVYKDQKHLRKVIVGAMREIVRTSRGVVVEGGAKLRLVMPRVLADAAVVKAARGFLAQVDTHREQFLNFGLSEERLAQLRWALDLFEAAKADHRRGRKGAATAQAGITAAIASGSEAARTLDLAVRNIAPKNSGLIAGWERSLRIVEGIRRRKKKE